MGIVIGSRRADAFDALVEGAAGARPQPAYDDLLTVVAALRAVPAPEARPEFVADLRSRLMAEAATMPVPDQVEDRLRLRPSYSPAPARHPRRRIAAAVGGLALAGVTGSVAVAAQGALPGELLYPVKRQVEAAHADLALDDGARGRTLLDSAGTRLDEVTQLSAQGSVDETQVSDTLSDFSEQSAQASDYLLDDYASTGDQGSITTLRTFTADSMKRLSTLQQAVPADSLDELLHAANVLQTIDLSAQQACPGCGGPEITTVPTVLTQAQSTAQGFDTAWLQQGSDHTTKHHGHPGHHGHGEGPKLPDLGGTPLPPGSVNPGGTGDPTGTTTTTLTPPTTATTGGDDPITDLTGGLTSGQESSTGTLQDQAGSLLNSVGTTVGNATGDLGDTVGDVGDSLTGGASPTADPTGLLP